MVTKGYRKGVYEWVTSETDELNGGGPGLFGLQALPPTSLGVSVRYFPLF
jgi:hypothetical protein